MSRNKSKELLVLPGKTKPLIEFALEACDRNGLDPLVITRWEKADLINYCIINNIEFQIVEPKGEWSNTVLQSQPYWHETNVLILPDTEFTEADQILLDLEWHLNMGANISLGLHYVHDPSKWGIVYNYEIVEKPTRQRTPGEWAWGLIAFKNTVGHELFASLENNKSFKLSNTSFVYIHFFEDLTRGTNETTTPTT